MLIFLAMPTKGSVLNNAIKPTVLAYVAQLHLDHPEHTFVAPMIQDYQLLRYMPQAEATWTNWGRHCRVIIERADAVLVLKYDGYDTSEGVRAEVAFAHLHDIPVFFIEPITRSS